MVGRSMCDRRDDQPLLLARATTISRPTLSPVNFSCTTVCTWGEHRRGAVVEVQNRYTWMHSLSANLSKGGWAVGDTDDDQDDVDYSSGLKIIVMSLQLEPMTGIC
jgi:hypothetical protein